MSRRDTDPQATRIRGRGAAGGKVARVGFLGVGQRPSSEEIAKDGSWILTTVWLSDPLEVQTAEPVCDSRVTRL